MHYLRDKNEIPHFNFEMSSPELKKSWARRWPRFDAITYKEIPGLICHCVRDSSILQDPDLDPPILRSAGGGFVARDRLAVAVAVRLNQPPNVHVIFKDEIVDHRLRTP